MASFGKSKVQALMDLQHDLGRSQAKPLGISDHFINTSYHFITLYKSIYS